MCSHASPAWRAACGGRRAECRLNAYECIPDNRRGTRDQGCRYRNRPSPRNGPGLCSGGDFLATTGQRDVRPGRVGRAGECTGKQSTLFECRESDGIIAILSRRLLCRCRVDAFHSCQGPTRYTNRVHSRPRRLRGYEGRAPRDGDRRRHPSMVSASPPASHRRARSWHSLPSARRRGT